MSELLRRLDALSPRRRALLTLRLVRRATSRFGARPVQDLHALPIRPLPRTGEALPLSFAQERLWFFDRLESRLGVYNMAYAVPVGAACPGRLGRSLDEAVRRHEVLRAVFPGGPPGEPRQQVLPFRPRPLPVVDLSSLPAKERETEHGRLRQEEGERPFDLARGPLLRTSLLRLSADESVLLVNFHHMVSDGWSMWVLMAEVAAAYEGASLPGLPIQYADFAAWQREVLASDALAGLTAFWRQTLAGAPDRLELPADRPRPAVQSFRGSVIPLALRSGDEIAALCRSRGATLFMVLLAAFQAVLRRWSGQEELVVGAVAANRGRSDVEGLVGCFVNTLALPARMPAGTTFDGLLAEVRSVALGGYAHQDLPFEKLVEELKVERSLAWSPLVQAMFVLQNTPAERHRLAGRELHPEEIHSGTSKLDLTLSITEGDLTGFVEYAADLFDNSTIRRLAAHFETLLAGALAAPESRLEDLPLLPEAERHQLLAEWNDTALVRPDDPCLHELIEAQVDRTPDAIAVVGGRGEEETLTWRQLDRRANALAWRLRALGVGPDTLVGISAERSPSMIVGLLAILKAGGGYVPLDPEYPAERLAYMLEDSAVPVLLAQPHLSERFKTFVPLGGDEEESRRPASGAVPESAAYAIYTSGSTGRPKGAVNSHRAIVNRLLWMQEEYGLDASDRVLQKTPFSFDVSVWELFWPLLAGARLVFARPGGHRDAAYLVDRIAAEGITTLHFVPSMLQVFLEERGLERCGSLRRVMASGEALPPDLADRFAQRLGPLGARLHNLYGPTEAAVDVTFRPCPGGERRVPIGRPIANLRIHILDREGRPAPVGVPGELHISGVGLARGYLRRPELTAERFVPDPLGAPGGRLYRTGDLARLLPSGEIEYLGRLDHQVKIRGVRIELGEVEAVLAEHPAVREAVALVRDGSLAAFVVLREAVPVADLRSWARERLPEALVPAAWAVLDALPLTPNGKADRKALSTLSLQPAEGAAWAPPRTPLEEMLARLWEELLGLERAGIHDRFFDLGGHSLLATRLVGRLGARLGIDVPLRAVFAAPTPAALAAWLEGGQGMPALPPIRPVPRDRALPLSFAQERIWFLERLEPGQAAYNIPFAFRLQGDPDVSELERRLTAIVRRHEVLRTVFQETGGEPRQEILPPRAFSLPVVDLQGLAELDRLIEDEARRPFDLSAEAPLRARLFRVDGRTSVLLFNLHHAAGDGWSLEILAEELGAASPLPELPVQYADFAAWQRQQLSGEVLERQVGWWREELAGAPALLELPADRPRPPLQTYRGSSLDFVLPAELAAAAKAFSRRQGATAFMVLFAAFQALLHRLTGQEDLLVGTVVANRRRAELEGLIGLFVNTLVLRGRAREDEGFGDLVERTRSTALGVYAHQDLPFERLIEELGVPRSLAHSPLFQVMFTLESAPRRPPALPGVETAPFPLPSFASKLDLTLYLAESEGGLAGTLEYASDLFDRATIGRLAGQLRELLAGALADPAKPVADLPLLTEAERRQLRDWNAGPAGEPAPVHRAFEEQARRTPDAVAVVCGGESLTYAELDLRAGRLARHLRDLGAGPDVLVAIALERSADLLVAVLGVLKSGAAWLPLDPSHPRERLAAILEDARPPLLIGDLESEATRVRLDDARGEPLHGVEALPDHLAYAIFTSGSTGRPKGVLVRRGAVANFLASMRRAPGLSADDVLLAVTTLAFDISVLELLLPLLVGGRVVIARRDEAADPVRLRALLDESGATVLQATPATWRMLLESIPPPGEGEGWLWGEARRGAPRSETSVAFGAPPPLPSPASREREPRRGLKALCGGEALPTDLARQLLGRVGSLWNLYGPTETTVWSAASEVRLDGLEGTSVAIAGPVDRTALVLVDRRLQPVPPGVPGEILIGGEGLARGYLGRPDLTAERFVPDPFGEPGARAYRTGDLARRRPSGEIDFLGRIDNQVKLRGFRIELGEIEAALAAHPAVREAVVLARGGAEDRTLEAFLVLDGEAPGLAGFLRGRLPEYMVPSAWTVLESLPLNANGKVDRRALAALERTEAVSEEPSALPRTPAEELLAGIWADVLGRERIGTRDSFFDLGGHSLLGSRVLARVANAFGVELPLRALFEAPTVSALAERLEAARPRPQAPPVRPVPRSGPLPLSFAQERLWFLDRLQPGSAAYNIPLTFELRGRLDAPALASALDGIVRRHEALRTSFPADLGTPRQEIADRWPGLAVIDLRGLPDEAGRRLAEEARRPFDLARGPLFRALLLLLGEQSAVLFAGLHHAVGDGGSVEILARELAALCSGQPLPALPVQYADFAAWQRATLPGILDGQLAWWRTELDGAADRLELPADRPRPPLPTGAGAVEPVELPAAPVLELARARAATPFMVLLSAFQALLHRYTGAEDVLVGSPASHRGPETEGLIGLFVNTLVLRGRFAGDPSFSGLLDRTRETALAAYARRDLPFERLVEELKVERSLAHAPLVQVLLVQQSPPEEIRLPGLTLVPGEVHAGTSRLDLTLSLAVSGERIEGDAEYSTELFDAATVRRLIGHLRTLLEGAAADPLRPVSELPLLTRAERKQLRVEAGEAPGPACLHDLVLAQAARTPDAPAVSDAERTLTYRELEERSRGLARRLRALGVGPEVAVGVAVPRSADLVTALLGVLRAGGAYVPLDLSHPAERVAFTIADAAVRVAVVPDGPAHRLPAGLQTLAPDPGEEGGAPLAPLAEPGNLAYLIYTSGSTGRPKGVAIEHRSAAAFLRWAAEVFGAEETVFAATSVSFDLSVFEIFLPLSRGGRVVVGENALALAGHPLAAEVTLLNTVPSAATELLRAGAVPPSVRTVNLAGEPLRNALAQGLYGLGTVERVWNLYGPSEDTTYSTAFLVAPGAAEEPAIGRPIRWTRAHVVDRNLHLLPVGVPGELCLSGEGLARGYLGRPDQTAERFVPCPFPSAPGARMYRTGDLARLRPSGDLDYLGRIDHQVKVRGFRIEPGEVEAALLAHPGVREAAVLARDGSLAAYVAGDAPPAALRAWLRDRLPEPMVPTVWAVLGALPLTPNGKIDRRALARIEPGVSAAEGAAPRTVTEELLAGLWCDALGLERVGVDESFFDLGGHSLTGHRILSRIGARLGVDLPVRALFQAPTVRALAALVDAGSRRRRLPPLVPVPRTGDLLLSFAQERLWLLDRLEPGRATYNLFFPYRLRGPLSVPALARGLEGIVDRHEALRTVFPESEGRARQEILPPGPLPLPEIDLRGLEESVREAELRRLLDGELRRPYDLRKGRLMRTRLARLAEREAVLFLGMHHIVSDGWSLGVIGNELSALYAGSALPPPPVQVADHAAWQRSWLQGEILEEQLAWWRQELAGLAPLLELPADRPRPAVRSERGKSLPAALPAELARSLRALSRREGATLFMTLAAGFQALLHRYTGQEDIPVGSPIAGRVAPELEGLVGFFVNTLVLRGRAPRGTTFRGLLAGTRAVALSAFAHQDLPFERVVEELRVPRSLSYHPVFQVLLAVQNGPEGGSLSLPGLEVEPLETPSVTAKFDLTLALWETDQGIAGTLEHALDLFDRTTAARLLEHLRVLLEGAAADPDCELAVLPLLGHAELHQVRFEWNDVLRPYPAQCVHELFEEQAALRPGAPAVSFGDDRCTYGELNARANRLAWRLLELGIDAGTPVALCLERSLDLVVTVLAILKAGGCYVPLDTSYPEERLAFMLEDSGAQALVTLERWLGRFPGPPVPALCLDREDLGRYPAEDPVSGALPGGPAYVLYTSGSTGRPKGVAVPHRAVVRLVRDNGFLALGPDDVLLQASNTSFDAATLEIWGALVNGGRLAGVAKETLLSPPDLAARIREEGITALFLTTALFNEMAAERPDAFRAVRAVMFGGEASDPSRARQVLQAGAPARLIHAYGPTESTTFATTGDIVSVPEGAASLPIGRPVGNTTLWVLDRDLRPAPVGVPGELCLGGDGLALGYVDRPGLTAERFVPHPSGAGERLYRTGDLVRWRADGTIDFLGRLDHQVKIRGYRIEPGEIEAVLASHPDLRSAAVLVRGAGAEARLCAYAVPSAPAVSPVSPAMLRSWLAGRLPEPMVPTAWALLPELPLTPNGKVDRRALAAIAPDEAAPEAVSPASPASPATPAEEILAGIFGELLGVERAGAASSFFDLGGHSLKASQLVSRVAAELGVELPLRAVFEEPTVAGMAARIDALRAAGEGLMAPPIVPVPRDRDLPLSFSQERLWFRAQMEPESPFYNIFVPLRLEGELDEPALWQALREIVRRHEPLRTVYPHRNGVPRQVVLPGAELPPAVVDLHALPAEQAASEGLRIAAAEGRRPFDVARGPVFRAALVRTAPGSSLLLLNLHHIAGDGWSAGILLRELAAFYAGAGLPELPVQYADFAVWQQEWLRGEILGRQLDYWRRELAGAPPLIDLPTDRPRPARPGRRGGVATMVLAAEAAGPLREASRHLGATLFMTCLAAFQLLLHRYTGQDDVVVGTPVAGRSRRETEGLIGCFVNTLALRGRCGSREGLTFRELVARARATALDAYVHQDLPFEKVVEELRVERSLRYNPVFQVLFALAPPLRPPAMPGLRVEPLDMDTEGSEFDLSLGLGEVGEEIWGGIRYSADLFDAATVETMLARYRALLEQAAADPDRPLAELAPWSDAERLQVLAEPELPEGEALESRLAARGQKVEDLRSGLSDAKKAMLASLLKRGRSGRP